MIILNWTKESKPQKQSLDYACYKNNYDFRDILWILLKDKSITESRFWVSDTI